MNDCDHEPTGQLQHKQTCGRPETNRLNVINMRLTTRGVSRNQGGKCWGVFNSISKIKEQSLPQQLQRVLV